MVNVAIIGVTGNSGTRIKTELLNRGHNVVAIARDPSKVAAADNLVAKQGNVVSDDLTPLLEGVDVVVHAYAPPQGNERELIAVTQRIAEAVQAAKVSRLIMVGGAGGLEVAPGQRAIDQSWFPEAYNAIATAHNDALAYLRSSPSSLNWTTLSPGMYFVPGERTGTFRLGNDNLIANESGESRISFEDYAIAIVDEIETPHHERARFSVGY